jgi:CIC family chloride channel protein
MLMVAEMTDSLAMLAPAMLAIGLATLIVGDRTIYASQVKNRAESPAHQFRFALPLMSAIAAGDAARAARAVLSADVTATAAIDRLESAGVPGAPVVESNGTVRGSVDLATLMAAEPNSRVGDLPLDEALISANDTLDGALGMLADGHRSWAPVVADDRLAGVLSARDAVAAYRRALASNVRQVKMVGSTGTLLEAEVGATSVLAGKPVAQSAWPRDSVLVSIARGEQVIVPRGHVILQAGDRLTVFTASAAREELDALLASQIVTAGEN